MLVKDVGEKVCWGICMKFYVGILIDIHLNYGLHQYTENSSSIYSILFFTNISTAVLGPLVRPTLTFKVKNLIRRQSPCYSG